MSGCVEERKNKDNNNEPKIFDNYQVQIIVDNNDNYSILLPVLPYTINSLDYIKSNISTNLKIPNINIITIYNITEINAIAQNVLKINFSTNFTLKYKYDRENVLCHGYLSLCKDDTGYISEYWVLLNSPGNNTVQIKLNSNGGDTEPEFQYLKNGWNIITISGPGRE
jgi:hypothetical protein